MNPIHPHCHFKTDRARDRAQYLHETAAALMYHMAEWCLIRGLPFVVTDTVSTPEEDQALKRTSDTHRTARAFDVSLKGWVDVALGHFCAHFEKEWGAMGAVNSAGQSRLIVRHNEGYGDHLHVQLSRTFVVKDPLKSLA